ncbi:MAG: cellulase family glycosylhydrolase [Verrucomicrobia bacterium]|nr:cellulase family glycosylhydrolase [Verrucomicrobiota bacterium]
MARSDSFAGLQKIRAAALGALISMATCAAWAGVPEASPPEQKLPKVAVAKDGKGFTAGGKRFVPWGVNYFRPGTGWAPQIWRRFDREATRQDFLRLKKLGVNCVRVFLTYGSFLRRPDRVEESGLRKLDQFLKIAEEAGIYVHPTGPDHWEGLPNWAQGDRVTDETALRALERFWTVLAARYRGRHVIFAYDLLNEPMAGWDSPGMRARWAAWLAQRYGTPAKAARRWNLRLSPAEAAAIPPRNARPSRRLLDFQHFREEVALEWTRRQTAAIKRADPDALVTVGLIQWSVPINLPAPWQYSAFRPARLARLLDFLEIHFYPLAGGVYAYQGRQAEQENLAYLEAVVREAGSCGKPAVLAEYGWYGGGKPSFARIPPATEGQQARWCEQAVRTSRGWVCGWLHWGVYDHPEARDVTQLIGLYTAHGKLKAWGRRFGELGAEFAANPPPCAPPKVSRPKLDWDACAVDPQVGARYLQAYARAFMQHPASSAPAAGTRAPKAQETE